MDFRIDPAPYPDNYDFLPEKTKRDIFSYIDVRRQMMRWALKNDNKKAFDSWCSDLSGSISAWRVLGIHVEHYWPGHRDDYFLATKADVERFNETLYA